MTAFHDSRDDRYLLSIFVDNTPDIHTLRAEEGLMIRIDERDDSQITAMRVSPSA